MPVPTRSLFDEVYDQLARARPFLRWVGGKQTFVARFGSVLPQVAGRYFEPFLGSGTVFFYLQRRQGRPLEAVLGDVNVPLVKTYLAIRDDPQGVARRVADLAADFRAADDQSAYYYERRSQYNASLPTPDPALFIFLNRSCWNGLYRVNRRGQFNVPLGRLRTGLMAPSADDLVAVSAALVRARLRAAAWETTISTARAGDFIFLDPPYYSDTNRDDTKYQRWGFGMGEHERLASRLASLCHRGVDFVLTNSAEPEMRTLYEKAGLGVTLVEMPRSVSGKIDRRQPSVELVVTPPARLAFWRSASNLGH